MMLRLMLLQVLASCLWLGHTEVVKSFETCPQFFYSNTTPNDALEPPNATRICQRYNNSYHFATLYDRDKRIPVYSAYIYQPGNGSRYQSWFVEPQLINSSYPKEMKTAAFLNETYHISRQQIGQNQAINQDYDNLKGLERGHLNPTSHQSGNNSKWATFTLTNIVPQNSTLNRSAWKKYENSTMTQKTQCCNITYVIVGAVPGNKCIANNRVNVPSFIWSAACCQTNTSMKTWAVIAQNNQNSVQILTLEDLESSLSNLYGKGQVTLFHKDCPRK